MDEILSFMKATSKAFADKGIEYGEVEFECPICSGNAWATRQHTPQNIAHSTTSRAGCDDCKMFSMN